MLEDSSSQGSLAFRACYHVEMIEPAMTFLFSEKSYHFLKGEIYALLSPLLKEGIYNEDQIMRKLEKSASSAEVYYALERLQKKGFIENSSSVSKELAAYCDLLGAGPVQAQEKLSQKKIGLINFSKVSNTEVLAGLKPFEVDAHPDLHLVVVDDYLDDRLKQWNEETSLPWLLMKPIGTEIWLGPFFTQKEKGCWECLAKRLLTNRIEVNYVLDKIGKNSFFPLSVGSIPQSIHSAISFASTELFKWIISGKSSLTDKMITIDFSSLNLAEHPFSKLMECSYCGTNNQPEFQPIQLVNRKKVSSDGGYRSITPESTLRKYSHLISPITGLIPKLNQASCDDTPIHVFQAGHNFALSNRKAGIHGNGFRKSSGGKGRTEAQSKAGALCEAIERYSGIFQGNECKVRAAQKELEDALDLQDILLISEKQYKMRIQWNSSCLKSHVLPKLYDPKDVIFWTPAWSLTRHKKVYLPTAFCYYGLEDSEAFDAFICNSNGCASGNNLEEAIFQGLLEVVERDAVAIWWYNQIQREQLDLKSFSDPYFDAIDAYYQKEGKEIIVLDITTDLAIPAFAAISRNLKGSQEILLGFGAHLNPRIAIERALSEMNQMLLFPRQWKEQKSTDSEILFYRKWLNEATFENQKQFQPKGLRKSEEYCYTENSDLLEDLNECRKRIEDHGYEIIVLDQTRRDIGLCVVRVTVPKLRHFWPRLAPGRLYEVPVKMGWLSELKKEEDLNPIPMFL